MNVTPMGFHSTPMVFHDRVVNEILEPSNIYLTHALQWLDDTMLFATLKVGVPVGFGVVSTGSNSCRFTSRRQEMQVRPIFY